MKNVAVKEETSNDLFTIVVDPIPESTIDELERHIKWLELIREELEKPQS